MSRQTNWRRAHRRKVHRRSLLSRKVRCYVSEFRSATIRIEDICALAGYQPGPDGRLALPNTQEAADRISRAAIQATGWHPGDPRFDLVLTGAGPVWAYLVIAHACHGVCRSLTYVSPVATIVVFRHDEPASPPPRC